MGSSCAETKRSGARDYTDLVRVTVTSGEHSVRVVGTLIGRRNRPHLLEAWGQRFDVQLEDHITLFRYRDVPGMIGRVGTIFGEPRDQHRLGGRWAPSRRGRGEEPTGSRRW